MSLPFTLFAFTGLLAVLAALLRGRPSVSGWLAAAGSLLMAGLVLWAPLDEPVEIVGLPFKMEGQWQVLGRAFVLDGRSRPVVSYLYLLGGLLFGGGWLARPGRYFNSLGLAMLGLLAAANSIEPFLFAAVFLELAAMAAVVILASARSAEERGTLQLLILYSMAMLVILFTGWLLENAGVTSVTAELGGRALLLLGVGFSILMLVPPFHFWLPSTAGATHPYALALVALALQSSGLFFLLRLLDTYAWLRAAPEVSPFLRYAGLLMLLGGGLAALAQARPVSMLAYALLSDFGASVMAIGLGVPQGYQLALGMSAARVVSLALAALGISQLADPIRNPDSAATAGAARRRPWPAAVAMLGVLGLAGFPLTPGFPGRWALLAHTASQPALGAALLAGTILVTLAAYQWARHLLGTAATEAPVRTPSTVRLFYGSALVLSSVLGLFPQVTFPWVVAALTGLTNLIP